MGTGKVSMGTPTRLRSFDPVRLADLEYRAWTGYYLRKWPQVLRASLGLVRLGFGMDWFRTVHGAWLVLRANQADGAVPGNHPKRARACMRRFYALVRLTYGEPSNPAKAAELEVELGARPPRTPARARPVPGGTGRTAGPPLRLPVRRPRGNPAPRRGTPGQGHGAVRPVGRGRLPARQRAAPPGARRPGPRLRRPASSRPPLAAGPAPVTGFLVRLDERWGAVAGPPVQFGGDCGQGGATWLAWP